MNDTIVWQTENEIVVPVTEQIPEKSVAVKAPRPVKPAPAKPALVSTSTPVSTTESAPASIPAETDSVAIIAENDSILAPVPGEINAGIILVDPSAKYSESSAEVSDAPRWDGMSWVFLVLVVLFCAAAIKFKGSSRYMKALLTDLTDTRLRHNAFDETVKETSLLVLMNVMWVATAGVLLWSLVGFSGGGWARDPLTVVNFEAKGIGICIGVAAVYLSVMLAAYWIVGNVFSDRKQTRMWVKGAAASTALETFILFPLSLFSLVYPAWNFTLLIIAAGVLIMGKIVFLYKGFRIFFTEISSWLLFLYYLCSLEIVPLIITYFGAVAACRNWL